MLSSCADFTTENQTQAQAQKQNKSGQTASNETTLLQSTALTSAEIEYNFEGLTKDLSDSPKIVKDENGQEVEASSQTVEKPIF